MQDYSDIILNTDTALLQSSTNNRVQSIFLQILDSFILYLPRRRLLAAAGSGESDEQIGGMIGCIL